MDQLDVYFASLVAMTLHPGYTRGDAIRPGLEECLALSVEMVELKEKLLWQLQRQE